MTTLIIELSDELMSKIVGTGHSLEEFMADVFEKTLGEQPTSVHQQPSKEEIIRRLSEAGYLSEPNAWNDAGANAWTNLSDEEKQQHIDEMNSMYFPDSPASRAIIENRKGPWGDVPPDEVLQRLLEAGLVRKPASWDDEYAWAWRNRPPEERERLIEEMKATCFPDSFASKLMIENRK